MPMNDAVRALVYRQLSNMMEAGVEPSVAFASISQTVSRRDSANLKHFGELWVSGIGAAKAAMQSGFAGSFEGRLLGAGELSGSMPQSLLFLSEHYEGQA